MKVSEQWLREWVNPDISLDDLGHQLTMAGLELDGIEPVAAEFNNVVICEIKEIEQHPDADRLRVCQVDVGAEENIQIVTNVATVQPGMKVPVAMIGAELPGEAEDKPFKIKKSKLRGVLSQGMFCGADTLGVGTGNDEGLLELPEDAPLGKDIREFLNLNDRVMEVDLTPDRADCLSIEGVAREVGVLTQTQVTPIETSAQATSSQATFPVTLTAKDACPHYAGRVIENINAGAETPQWMQEKLRRAGLRSLSPIVDITNYVLIELGQPMHAFDLQKLNGQINVRYAEENEKLTLLDGQEVTLDTESLVIADDSAAVALAGVMGGEPTSVIDETQHIFLESAFFKPEKIAGKARQYGLHTDSSHRFERGVSPDLQIRAMERATQLITEICGGEVGEIIEVTDADNLPQKATILLRKERVKRLLGIDIPAERVEDILTRLAFDCQPVEQGWEVIPPLFRFDISIEADLIEELARVYGYDQIPAVLRDISPRITVASEEDVEPKKLANVLVDRDYQEAVTFSFVGPEIEALLSPASEKITLANPISADLSVMRGTLWSGLIPAAIANLNRQQSRVRLFETGLTFVKNEDGEMAQRKQLAGLITGSVAPEQWSSPSRAVDFYDIKGDVEALLAEASAQRYTFVPVDHPALHPGQSAQIVTQTDAVGWIGALHPRIEQKLGLTQQVFLFELDMALIAQKKLPAFQGVSRFPSIRRDLALVVNEAVSALAIEQAIEKAGIPQLINYTIFDIYTGQGVEKGQKSVALSLILQDFSRTLEDAEINGHVEKVVESLQQETGAQLR